ncbi:hypothetical protein [Cerasicoccus maritimus]|uniref:hypothetical protein n=1 Tax=Cerasicoccus maritimus TaxID=490089 RepID=UPI002852CCFA|nr:hypothetical protein [Cerasicoccus maritimus]
MQSTSKFLTFEDSGFVFGIDIDYVTLIERCDADRGMERSLVNPYFEGRSGAFELVIQLGSKQVKLPTGKVREVIENISVHPIPVFTPNSAMQCGHAFFSGKSMVYVVDVESLIRHAGVEERHESDEEPELVFEVDLSRINTMNPRWLTDLLTIADARSYCGTLEVVQGDERIGDIHLKEGLAIKSACGDLTGADALSALSNCCAVQLLWRHGKLPDMLDSGEPIYHTLTELHEILNHESTRNSLPA